MVDVTIIPKTKANSRDRHLGSKKENGDRPSYDLCAPEEKLTRLDVPADLQMHEECPNQDPHIDRSTTKDNHGSTEGTSKARCVSIGCDVVVTLVRLLRPRNNKAELNYDCRENKAHVEIMPSRHVQR